MIAQKEKFIGAHNTRVMSPKHYMAVVPTIPELEESENDNSLSICTQLMDNNIWVSWRCYTYGHLGFILITVMEGYTFCQECAAWANNEVEKVKQQQQIVDWKELCSINWKAGKRASIFAAGILSTIGLAVGGTPAVIAQGSVALLGEVAAGDAAASSAGEQIQQAVAVAQSTCLTEGRLRQRSDEESYITSSCSRPTIRIYQIYTKNAKVPSRNGQLRYQLLDCVLHVTFLKPVVGLSSSVTWSRNSWSSMM